MDANEVDAESVSIDSGATEAGVGAGASADTSRPSLLRSSWRTAKTGVRLTSYVAGPIAAVALMGGLVLTTFGVGSGRGWPFGSARVVKPILLGPFGFYLSSVLWGFILGALTGLVGGLIRRAWPGLGTRAWWGAANRPIRRFRWRQDGAGSIDTTLPRRRRRRWPWLVGAPVLLVLAAAYGAGAYLGKIVDHRLAAAIAEADRNDPFWRLDDLMAHRDPVPDAENSALVVAEALSLLPERWPAGPAPLPGEPNPPPTEAAKAFDKLGLTPDNVRLDEAVADTLRDELNAYSEGVRIARTVVDYARGRHELEIGPTIIDTPLSETQAARALARLLSVDAAIRAHDGDPDGALDSCRAILGTGRSIGDEPFLISQLVRIAIGMVATKSVRRVLGQSEPSDAALARLQSLVLDELAQPLLLHAMKGERATLVEVIARVGAGEVPISALSDTKIDPSAPRAVIAPWGKLWFDRQRAAGLEWMNEAVGISRQPATAWPPLWKAWEYSMNRVERSWHGRYAAMLPLLMLPALSSASVAHSRFQSDLGAMAVLLAAERHRRRTGDWPASIAAIDPAILPSPPVDPFSGQSFRMERRDGQILIHSIGPNRKDEHGAFDPKRWMNGGPDDIGTGAWDVILRRQPPGPKVR